MMRRLAAGAAAAALGVSVLATAAPASADPGHDPDWDGGYTRLSLDVGPEPAWEGRGISISGKLSVECEEDYIDGFVVVTHADHCRRAGGWKRLGGKSVVILFKADGSHKWEHVDTVRTHRDGYYFTKERAWTSGTWRAVFEGAWYLRPAEATDWVKVVRH
ncbi:hypothetical protein [Nonomuraea africana]|uniref:Secreted protein n=1 Tax=Nonomuraea africana TaxID=46171 RepID=A0ABR9KFB8_9ACTN|nr:hypothetical protein [Nonomuraea africana]MBE1560718.1 hypothetical protein [Nonomuraea africana]